MTILKKSPFILSVRLLFHRNAFSQISRLIYVFASFTGNIVSKKLKRNNGQQRRYLVDALRYEAVSYTHLDVYKRQSVFRSGKTKAFGSSDFYWDDPASTLQLYTSGYGGRLSKGTYYIKVQKYGCGSGYYQIKWK